MSFTAFQTDCFMLCAFQAEVLAGDEKKAAGSYPDYDEKKKKKKKYVVRVGEKLLVFSNEVDALNALPVEEEKKQYPQKKKRKEVSEPDKKPYVTPDESVRLEEIARMAEIYRANAEYQAALVNRRYEALIALYERFKRESDEEDELLLLAA